jgi:hypothetical protein
MHFTGFGGFSAAQCLLYLFRFQQLKKRMQQLKKRAARQSIPTSTKQ